jgi:hypothetical protein
MEDLTLPSVGGSLKKWVYYVHPFSPNAKKYLSIQKIKFQKNKIKFKNSVAALGQARGQRATAGRVWVPLLSFCIPIFLPASPFFPPL